MRVFVYGTLTDPQRATQVLDDVAYVGTATLSGLHRVEGAYPTLAPGGDVEGRLLETDEIDRLDAYEGVDRGLYVRIPVPIEGESETAAVYVGDPAALDAPARWPGEEPFPDCLDTYWVRADVSISIDQ